MTRSAPNRFGQTGWLPILRLRSPLSGRILPKRPDNIRTQTGCAVAARGPICRFEDPPEGEQRAEPMGSSDRIRNRCDEVARHKRGREIYRKEKSVEPDEGQNEVWFKVERIGVTFDQHPRE